MKKIILTIAIIVTPFIAKGQELDTKKITNWNTLRKSGFFESNIENALNAPGNASWYWGVNIGHSANTSTTSPYYYGGQITFMVSTDNTKPPTMFIRSTDINGKGIWAKVIHNQGNQLIEGNLSINGTIRSKEVKIEATGWADFVFDKEYKLPSLESIETHILSNKHLPGIPSEKEVKENGIDLGDIQIKLLQKIEELTLYMIDQNKEIQILKEENKAIKSQLNINQP